jgi:hypothetical protein
VKYVNKLWNLDWNKLEIEDISPLQKQVCGKVNNTAEIPTNLEEFCPPLLNQLTTTASRLSHSICIRR